LELSWIGGTVQIDGLAWSERQLGVFVDMKPELSDIFSHCYTREKPNELFDQCGESCNPSTPGATTAAALSYEGTPEPSVDDEKKVVHAEGNMENRIKVKKSDCWLRLFSALIKRTEKLST
jgi:hypothetical protein